MAIVHFNREAPPNFEPLHPDRPIRKYFRRLPHWRQDGATYFVTFRLADSIPQAQLKALKEWREIWERANPEPRSESQWRDFARNITNKTEAWLDEGLGECPLADSAVARLVSDAMLTFQDVRCFTSSFVIMPNHVHWTVKPLDGFELSSLLKSVKGYVGRTANRLLNRSGEFWAEESYDRIIRDEEHLWEVIQYIGRNPAKARLPKDRWYRWIHPAWEKAGWGFEA